MLVMSVHYWALRKAKRWCYYLLISTVCFIAFGARSARSDEIVLKNVYWSVEVSPETLQINAGIPGRDRILLSKGQHDLGPIGDLVKDGFSAKWLLQAKEIKV